MNQALAAGTRIRGTLGCSFLTETQVRNLNIPGLQNPADITRMIVDLENIVRLSSLNLEPGFDSPATRGTLPRTDTEERNRQVIALPGRWKSNGDDAYINFVQEGGKIVGYISDPQRHRIDEGYRNNEKIIEVTRESDRSYKGQFLYRSRYLGGRVAVQWTSLRIQLTDNTTGPGRSASIIYIDPRTPDFPESRWYYYRVD